MHLVSFIIRIYHDARSPERQITYDVFKVILANVISSVIPPMSPTMNMELLLSHSNNGHKNTTVCNVSFYNRDCSQRGTTGPFK